jgi:hypothetical protein
MMNWIAEKIPAWNSWLALMLYWLPLALCAYGYAVRTFVRVRKDRNARKKASGPVVNHYGDYRPSITIGSLAGYLFLTVTPCANLFAAIFDVSPVLFRVFFDWCARVLDMPLVPKRDKEPPHD